MKFIINEFSESGNETNGLGIDEILKTENGFCTCPVCLADDFFPFPPFLLLSFLTSVPSSSSERLKLEK